MVVAGATWQQSTVYLPIAVLVLSLVYLSWRMKRPRNMPPGPFDLPIIGTVLNLPKGSPHLVMMSLAKKYGDIFTLRIGTHLVVVLNSAKVAREALINNADIFSERFVPPVFEYVLSTKGSLIFGTGQDNKDMRKFISQSFRHFGVGKKSLESKLNEEAKHVIDYIDDQDGGPTNLKHIINNAVSNIICSITFGDRFEYNDNKFKKLLEMVHTIATQLTFFGAVQIFPFLVETPLYSHIKVTLLGLKEFVKGIVEDHRKMMNTNDPRDILDLFLLERKRQTDAGETITFKEEHEWRMFFELFLAGTDTTTNTLLFMLIILAYYPDIQEKIQHEVDTVIGSSRVPQYEDRKQMPLTEAVILEVLRSRPAAPLGVPRLATTDCTIGGYQIPKGTGVILNIWAIMHDPREWKDPDLFDPSRFIDENENKSKNCDAIMTFGIGRRACIGESLAKMELFLFITNLLQRFTFSFPEGRLKSSLEGEQGLSLKPKDVEICAIRR